MVLSRSRSRVRNVVTAGTLTTHLGTVINGYSGTSDYEVCNDYTQPPPFTTDTTLLLTRQRAASPLRFSGTIPRRENGTGGYITCAGYNPTNRSSYGYAPSIPVWDNSYWMTKALANIDPYRPVVDLPLFLFEFKDFPRMLRQLGNVLTGKVGPGDVPGGWLSYQFGWAPLVSDLKSLFDLTKSIDDRVKYLKSLEAGQRIKRTLSRGVLSDSTSVDNYALTLNTTYLAYVASTRNIVDRHVWFTANGKLNDPLPNDPAKLRFLAKRQVLGLSARPWDVWEFLPWSWLIDYFINVGDYLKAHGGRTSLTTTRLNLMCTDRCISRHTGQKGLGAAIASPSLMTTVVKRRTVTINPTPALAFKPFLTATQVANLGALVTARPLERAFARR